MVGLNMSHGQTLRIFFSQSKRPRTTSKFSLMGNGLSWFKK